MKALSHPEVSAFQYLREGRAGLQKYLRYLVRKVITSFSFDTELCFAGMKRDLEAEEDEHHSCWVCKILRPRREVTWVSSQEMCLGGMLGHMVPLQVLGNGRWSELLAWRHELGKGRYGDSQYRMEELY